MSNQPPPPSRPWYRLSSLAVPPAMTPAPQPPPPATTPMPPPVGSPPLRPTIILPTFVRTAVPEPTPRPPSLTPALLTFPGTTPAPERQPLPPVPVPRLPAPPPIASIKLPPAIPVIETLAPPTSTTVAPPTVSPPAKKLSPVLKPVAPPPTPLKLPPPQIRAPDKDVHPGIPLEAEQKNVLFQKSIAVPKQTNGNRDTIRSVWAQKPGVAATTVKGVSDVVPTTGTGNGIIAKKKAEPGEIGAKVIMIAGENKGAVMELARSAKNHYYKTGNNASSGSSSDEGKHRREDKGRNGKAPATASLPTVMYTNSNVQCVNNSILYNGSCTSRDPGVHFSLTRKPAEGVFAHTKEHKAA